MAWNWFVNKDTTGRERFAGPLVISGLVVAGLLLLVVLYPEKSLLKLLSNQEVSSPAQRRYLEALIRLRPDDSALVMVLARSYLASKSPLQALKTLDYLREPLPVDIRKASRQMRYEALRQRLVSLPANSSELIRTRQLFADQVELMQQDGATRQELETYLADARRVGDTVSTERLQTMFKPPAESPAATTTVPSISTPESKAAAAIARREYRNAASIYFAAMQSSRETSQRRRFFLSGVRALQSGNQVADALAAGEKHINGLAKDRETLLFMARLALTANRPDRSQIYIRRALGMPTANGGAS